jgi:hypothetical protein
MASEWMHQDVAIVGTLDPVAVTTASTAWFDYVDMEKFEKVAFIVQTNTVAANTTLVLTAYAGAITATTAMTAGLATSTTLTNAHDDSQIWVEVDTEDMDVDGRDRYVRAKLVVGGTAGTVVYSGIALGGNCVYRPASDYDLASVVEITNS